MVGIKRGWIGIDSKDLLVKQSARRSIPKLKRPFNEFYLVDLFLNLPGIFVGVPNSLLLFPVWNPIDQ